MLFELSGYSFCGGQDNFQQKLLFLFGAPPVDDGAFKAVASQGDVVSCSVLIYFFVGFLAGLKRTLVIAGQRGKTANSFPGGCGCGQRMGTDINFGIGEAAAVACGEIQG